MTVTEVSHPLAQHKLGLLRDERTSTADFRRIGGWELAPEPKTTFDNLAAFLLRAEDAWGPWSNSANGRTVIAGGGSNRIWEFTLPTGETIAGRFGVTPSGDVVHISVYPYRRGDLTAW